MNHQPRNLHTVIKGLSAMLRLRMPIDTIADTIRLQRPWVAVALTRMIQAQAEPGTYAAAILKALKWGVTRLKNQSASKPRQNAVQKEDTPRLSTSASPPNQRANSARCCVPRLLTTRDAPLTALMQFAVTSGARPLRHSVRNNVQKGAYSPWATASPA